MKQKKMPAKSKKQRRFMAMMEHNPKMAKARGIHMTKAQMHDFATTKEKGLPMKKKSRMTPAKKKKALAKAADKMFGQRSGY